MISMMGKFRLFWREQEYWREPKKLYRITPLLGEGINLNAIWTRTSGDVGTLRHLMIFTFVFCCCGSCLACLDWTSCLPLHWYCCSRHIKLATTVVKWLLWHCGMVTMGAPVGAKQRSWQCTGLAFDSQRQNEEEETGGYDVALHWPLLRVALSPC